jgi:hypothetical protein
MHATSSNGIVTLVKIIQCRTFHTPQMIYVITLLAIPSLSEEWL